jgi:hypothetical protein
MSAEIDLFKGIRETWKGWKKIIEIKLMKQAVINVAYNRIIRPIELDIANWAWESDVDKERAQSVRRKEMQEWDDKNEKASAIIVENLHPDIIIIIIIIL